MIPAQPVAAGAFRRIGNDEKPLLDPLLAVARCLALRNLEERGHILRVDFHLLAEQLQCLTLGG